MASLRSSLDIPVIDDATKKACNAGIDGIRKYISEAKVKLAEALSLELKDVELYSRLWTRMSSDIVAVSEAQCFSVMQFNILARGLSSGPDDKSPFPAKFKGDFGSFDAVPRPEIVFDWSVRRWRLVEEILRFSPDIIAMEEVDHFLDFLEPVLKVCGYDGIWMSKTESPDGTAIFWKRDQFHLGHAISSSTTNSTTTTNNNSCHSIVRGTFLNTDGKIEKNGYCITHLVHTVSMVSIIVGATHLKAKPGQENEDRRFVQINQLLEKICTITSKEMENNTDVAIILCDPFDIINKHKARVIPAIINHTGLDVCQHSLRSAYPLPTIGDEESYTTWKMRKGKESRHVIDYIFHSKELQPVQFLNAPISDDVAPSRLPGIQYPSDHISIMVQFQMSCNKSK